MQELGMVATSGRKMKNGLQQLHQRFSRSLFRVLKEPFDHEPRPPPADSAFYNLPHGS
jgi:hypothetical protein